MLLDGAQGVGAIAGGRARARLRRLRRRRAEVAVRPRRHGDAVREPEPARAAGGLAARLSQPGHTPTPGWRPRLHEDARRFDSLVAERRDAWPARWRRPSVLASAGWPAVHDARALAGGAPRRDARPSAAASRRRAARRRSCPFRAPTRPAERARLAEKGIVVRNIPGRPWLRASVGAWNDEGDLDRLLEALSL